MSQEELNRINKALYNAYQGLDRFGDNSPQGKMTLREIEYLKAEKAKLPPELLQQEIINNTKSRLISAVKAQRKFPDIAVNQQDVEKYTMALKDLGFSEDDIHAVIKGAEAEIIEIVQKNILEALKQELQLSIADTNSPLEIDLQDVMDGISDVPQNIIEKIKRAIDAHIERSTIQTIIDSARSVAEQEKKQKLAHLTSHVKSYVSTLNFKASLDPSAIVPDDMIQLIAEWEYEDQIELDRSVQNKIIRAKRDLEAFGVSEEEIRIAIRIGQYTASDA